jgi:hypothetical protein
MGAEFGNTRRVEEKHLVSSKHMAKRPNSIMTTKYASMHPNIDLK